MTLAISFPLQQPRNRGPELVARWTGTIARGDPGLYPRTKAICKQLGLDERLSLMVDIKRLKAGTLSDGDNGLVLVQFALKNQRDNFYSTYLRKHNLQLSHLGIDSAHRVYVNENLTRSAQKLKAAAIRLKKAGKLFTVHTKLGVVYVRRVATLIPSSSYPRSN